MTKLGALKMACIVFLLCTAMAIAVLAQTFTTLANFDGSNGFGPGYTALVQGADGSFYGTTEGGGNQPTCAGTGGCGTAFKINQGGTLNTLYQFCSQPNCSDGIYPMAGLVFATDGQFYGTSLSSVFKMTGTGKLTTLNTFGTYVSPYGALIQATDGNFYGTTYNGGSNGNGYGTVFRMTPAGERTTLYVFCALPYCTDGYFPAAGLAQGTDGNFYGTTSAGGLADNGTVFKITPTGTLTTLHSFSENRFNRDGRHPYGALIQASDGNFYGTTNLGGNSPACNGDGCGTIFRINARGTFKKIYAFSESTGSPRGPFAGLIQATDGTLYGTTAFGGDMGYGTIFNLNASGTLTVLHSFVSTDGAYPYDNLLQATDGNFYGTTANGGAYNCKPNYDCGTVFKLSTGLGPFVSLVRAVGKVGQTGGVLGQGFTAATTVSFNGIPATFTVVSDTYLKATVPAGATTGYVTVTTPSGTLTSNVPFHVLP